jgi:hypothetical protein
MRTRATVAGLTSSAAPMAASVHEGPASPWLALSRIRAWVSALAGAAVKRAAAAISQGHEPLWPWLLPFDQPQFAGYLGSCATRLNLARTAIPALVGALGTGRTKQWALVLADLAVNHRALGHSDEARTLADEARAIGVEFGSEKVLGRLAA